MERIGPFKKHEENIECYTERLEAYFTANGVSADKQARVLISEMGTETYTPFLRGYCTPARKLACFSSFLLHREEN